MKQLRVRWTLSELTLGHVWDVDVERNEKVIRDVLLVAQGERALEEFLRQVRVGAVLREHRWILKI